MKNMRVAIIGVGNIGMYIARGLAEAKGFSAKRITLTRRKVALLKGMEKLGFQIQRSNAAAVASADVVIVAVEPQQMDEVLDEIAPALDDRHVLISVVTGVSAERIRRRVGASLAVARAMPNTAIAVRQSMTCLAAPARPDSPRFGPSAAWDRPAIPRAPTPRKVLAVPSMKRRRVHSSDWNAEFMRLSGWMLDF